MQESLFNNNVYHNPEFHRHKLPLVSEPLPELAGVSDQTSVDFEIWYDDGVSLFADNWNYVLAQITGIESAEDITELALQDSYQKLISEQAFGRAASLAEGAQQLNYPNKDDWESKSYAALLARVHLGLVEATMLPLSTLDENDEIVSASPMRPKHFWSIYNSLTYLAEQNPEQIKPYLKYADSLHLEMILKYPDLGNYTHQMWKNFDDQYGQNAMAIYERIKTRDDDWREGASNTFTSGIVDELRLNHFGRVGQLVAVGLASNLVTPDFVSERFLDKHATLDLGKDIIDDAVAMNSIIVPHEFPKLTNLKGAVNTMWWANNELRSSIETAMARRELETVQTILKTQTDTLSPNVISQLSREQAELAQHLPDDDSNKAELIKSDMETRTDELVGSEHLSALGLGRLIEDTLVSLDSI